MHASRRRFRTVRSQAAALALTAGLLALPR
jgi:hypothetical protein